MLFIKSQITFPATQNDEEIIYIPFLFKLTYFWRRRHARFI